MKAILNLEPSSERNVETPTRRSSQQNGHIQRRLHGTQFPVHFRSQLIDIEAISLTIVLYFLVILLYCVNQCVKILCESFLVLVFYS